MTNRHNRSERMNIAAIVTGIFLFAAVLAVSYTDVYALYSWYGYEYKPDIIQYVVSFIMLTPFAFVVARSTSINKPSSIVLFFLFLFAYIPNILLFAGMSLPYSFFIYSNVFWASTYFFERFVNFKLTWLTGKKAATRDGEKDIMPLGDRITVVPRNENSINTSMIIFYSLLLGVIVFSLIYNGLSLTLDLKDVNTLRMNSRVNQIGWLMDIILPFSANMAFPMIVIWSLKRKKLIPAVLFTFGEVIAFSINGTKTWLFGIVTCILVALFVKKSKQFALMPIVLSAITMLSTLLSKLFNFHEGINYLTRRVFYATSLNNWFWIDFFTDHSKTFFTDSILGWVRRLGIHVPYDLSVARIIGTIYYNDSTTNAASGTIAVAYSNLGVFGLVIYPLITVVVLKLVDAVSEGVDIIYLYPLVISSALYLLNGGVSTLFFSYGYALCIILIIILKRRKFFS